MKNIRIPQNIRDGVKLLALVLVAGWALVFAFPWACTSQKSTVRTLEAAGYRDVIITGWRPFMRGGDDWFSTGFRATAPNGSVVTGAVTGGLLFKGNTIRTD